ncbi:hypothetical protein SAMN04489743_3349 [Pseudarthrobacter equi]|uniref:PknH-like extracellular domain-containing protein n=1 Tax=Pseudarthrobacter equi TaxID=728066 RepID=A0A1H2B0X3_9MICC|nr:hypothetical protein [Pseudarthrobacter equi]SDT51920.1 hypothetical protein SAMN04489743_3349 [Pseudarthrobacter equi]
MRRRPTQAALLMTVFLALAGCGSGTGTGTGTATSSPPAPSPTPSPAKTYTDADLSSIVGTLKDSQGRALTVVPAAQIDQGIIKAKEILKGAVFTPPECNVFADSNSQIPEDSTYAAGTTISAADKTAIVVTAIALKDAKELTGHLEASRKAVAACGKFTAELAGQKVTTEVQEIDAATGGDQSFAALAKESLSTGEAQTSLTMTGIKGNLAATAVKAGPDVTPADAAELVQLIDTILAHG